jgi:hypothetical protein
MSYGRDSDAPEAADADADFVGPLRPAEQAWSEHVLRADSSAALFEPADNVIRRREAHIGGLYRTAALLALSGDLAGGSAAGFRAIAEARALAEFLAASPSYCLDCFVLGDRCAQHRAGSAAADAGSGSGDGSDDGSTTGSESTDGPAEPGHQPDWRRFGADGFPSASG